jgi:hypothetical protein
MRVGKAGAELMDMMTIEGVYRNGRVELAEYPEGVEQAKVVVTFLAEAETGRTKSLRKGSASQVRSETALIAGDRYPEALRDEYEALIHKKLLRAMTEDEAARLEAVRAEINHLDRQSESWPAWERRADGVDLEIADLRQELEALPDA